MDLDAVLARRPEIAVVDELAHTNVPGSRHDKRWQDVQELLDAGIDVLSTVNVQHLESVNDVVAQITGTTQRETVPDEIVRAAEQVELVDMTPEALRRRMAHGNIYRPDKIDAALGNYFRVGNLTALRELALLWLADKVDEQLDRYRSQQGIAATWEARERVVVALTGGPEGETLIRRAARVAARSKGADLLAVHVARSDGLAGADPAQLARQRVLVESLGGTYHQVLGTDVPAALLDFARGVNATQLVLGASRRGRLAQIFARGVGVTTTALSGSIDVHLVTHKQAGRGRRAAAVPAALSRRRRLLGFGLAVLGMPLLTLLLKTTARPDADQRHPAVPGRGGRGGAGRRGVAGPGRRARRLAAAQLVLHPAVPHADHRRGGQPARPGRLRRGGAGGELGRRRGRPAYPGGGAGRRRRADPRRRRRWRAARRTPTARAAGSAPGDLRAARGERAGAGRGGQRAPGAGPRGARLVRRGQRR